MQTIELMGTSRAGKSTLKANLINKLNQKGIIPKIIGKPEKDYKEFGTPTKFNNYIIDGLEKDLKKYEDHFVILDRGPHDREVLLGFDYNEGAISKKDYRSVQKRLNETKKYIDHGFVFTLSPEESLKRLPEQMAQSGNKSHLRKGLPYTETKEKLNQLNERYKSLLEIHPNLTEISGLKPKDYAVNKALEKIKL